MEKSGAKAYLVNTGWNGTGKRISIKDTRGIIDAILSGAISRTLLQRQFHTSTSKFLQNSRVLMQESLIHVTHMQMLHEWEEKAKDLAARFVKNFAKYEGNAAGKALVAAGPQA